MARLKLTEREIVRRLPLWCALAALFLDTEIQPGNYRAVALAAKEGGFSPKEVCSIFREEVFPAFVFNLLSVAGEWAGFLPEFVRDQVLEPPQMPLFRYRCRIMFVRHIMMKNDWPKVEAEMKSLEMD